MGYENMDRSSQVMNQFFFFIFSFLVTPVFGFNFDLFVHPSLDA